MNGWLFMYPVKWCVVFVVAYIMDWVWAKYMRTVADGVRSTASFYAMLVILLGAVNTRAYVDDWTLVIPAMFGAACGTWHSVGKTIK